MIHLHYKGQVYPVEAGQSVLEALEKGGVKPPASCRNGVCQTCKKKALSPVDPLSQKGLKDTEKAQGYFLPCICRPSEDLSIEDGEALLSSKVKIAAVHHVAKDIAEIQLSAPLGFKYRPGQYIQVQKCPESIRTYSLASLPQESFLSLHVRKVPGGKVSEWLHQRNAGDEITIAGPLGDCFYQPADLTQPMLLIGTGTGLAPLYGIIQDALAQGHQGPIYLFHGVERAESIYKRDELLALSSRYPAFHYIPCLSAEEVAGFSYGMVLDVALNQHPKLNNYRVYLSGHPLMVKNGSKKAFLSGARLTDIYADPFA